MPSRTSEASRFSLFQIIRSPASPLRSFYDPFGARIYFPIHLEAVFGFFSAFSSRHQFMKHFEIVFILQPRGDCRSEGGRFAKNFAIASPTHAQHAHGFVCFFFGVGRAAHIREGLRRWSFDTAIFNICEFLPLHSTPRSTVSTPTQMVSGLLPLTLLASLLRCCAEMRKFSFSSNRNLANWKMRGGKRIDEASSLSSLWLTHSTHLPKFNFSVHYHRKAALAHEAKISNLEASTHHEDDEGNF